MTKKDKGRTGWRQGTSKTFLCREHTQPIVTGQSAEVLNLIREHQPILSFDLTANHAIPEAAARVHDLRSKGFNILTTIVPEIEFRGATRRNVALYSLGTPAWPRPGFLEGN